MTLEQIVIPNTLHAVREPQAIILEKLERYQYSRDAIFAVRLAFQEAVSNAVRHGNRGDPNKTVTIGIAINTERAVIQVEDEGNGFDPRQVPDPTLPERISLPDGRGLMLIQAYMSNVVFNERGNRIRMIKVNE